MRSHRMRAEAGRKPFALADVVFTFTAGNAGTSAQISLPPSIAAGDLLYLCARVGNTSGLSWTAPSGWTLIEGTSTNTGVVFYRLATGTETAPTIGTYTLSSGVSSAVLRFTTAQEDARASVQSPSSTTHTFTSLTFSKAGLLTAVALATTDTATFSTPTNMTLFSSESGGGQRSAYVWTRNAAAGATGAFTTTRNPTGTAFITDFAHISA